MYLSFLALYPQLDESTAQSFSERPPCKGCFHSFSLYLQDKLQAWTAHVRLHTHTNVRWGQDNVLFPLSVFQT